MKLDRTEKGGRVSTVGILLFLVAVIALDFLDLNQTWKVAMHMVMLFGAGVFFIGAGIVYSEPMLTHK